MVAKEYDLAFSWDKDPCIFTDHLISNCRRKGLSRFWITRDVRRKTIKDLESGTVRIGTLLDTEATYDIPGDEYARLCYAVKDSGGVVINDPDRTRLAVDKSVMYYETLDAGICTPYTVVVRNWEPRTFRLTDAERERLGIPFIIKPGCGYGHQGVVYDAKGSVREIAEARDYDPGDNFLLQEKIVPLELDGKRAWFRVFHIFDKIIPCWWDDRTGNYEQATLREFEKFRLAALARITARVARLSRMAWFSCEIALDRKDGRTRFLVIDYVNDQCDMESKSEGLSGVPDNIVKLTALSIVHEAARISRRRRAPGEGYKILLADRKSLLLRGLGRAPDLLKQYV